MSFAKPPKHVLPASVSRRSSISIALVALVHLSATVGAQSVGAQSVGAQSVGAQSADHHGEKREVVTILEGQWNSGRVVQHVITEILETRLGVEVRALGAGEASDASTPQDEIVDITPEIWMPGMADFWRSYIAPGSAETVRVNAAPYFGREGLYIPGYVQDRYGIEHVTDLADPEIAKLFDQDGNGRGELWPGDPLWYSPVAIEELKARSYGYAPYFEMLQMESRAFLEHFRAAYKARRPILFYGWEPSDRQAFFDVRRLAEPAFDGYAIPRWPGDSHYLPDGCWRFVDPTEDPDWQERSTVRCAYPESEIWVGFRADLARRLPEVGRFLERLEISDLLIRSWMRLVHDFEMEPAEMAETWVRENPQIVNDWLGEGPPTLRLALLEWDTGQVVGAVLKVVLEERLGFRVREITDDRSFLDRVGRAGYLDIYPDMWLPEKIASWRRQIAPGSVETVRVSKTPYPAHQGLYVPDELESIRHVDDLKKEEVIRLLDADGDGKGEAWYGEVEWPTTWIFETKARSYGFAESYEQLHFDSAEMENRLREAKAQGGGLLVYDWEPSVFNARHGLRRLEEPPFDGFTRPRWEGDPLYQEDGCWNFVEPTDDPRWRELSEIRCASPPSEAYIAYSAELERTAPAAAKFLSRVELDQKTVGLWIERMAKGETAAYVARQWVAENTEIVERWVGDS